MNVCCVFTLESPHRGDPNEYTQYTIINMNMKNTLNYSKFAPMGFFYKGLQKEFETAVVNEPSFDFNTFRYEQHNIGYIKGARNE